MKKTSLIKQTSSTKKKTSQSLSLDSVQEFFQECLDRLDDIGYKHVDDWFDLKPELNLFILKNSTSNEIESRLYRRFDSMFSDSTNTDLAKIQLVEDIDFADVILFTVSEHLSTHSMKLLSRSKVPKIGIITSVSSKRSFNNVTNLMFVYQMTNVKDFGDTLKSLYKSSDADTSRLMLSYLIDVVRDEQTLNSYKVAYHPILLKSGLLTLMASSLPSRYSHLLIECSTDEESQYVASQLIINDASISQIDNFVSIQVNTQKGLAADVIQTHGEASLLKLIRKVSGLDD